MVFLFCGSAAGPGCLVLFLVVLAQKASDFPFSVLSDFSVWLGVPYRTMQEWELGRRAMPEYVLRLIAYKVMNELREGRSG